MPDRLIESHMNHIEILKRVTPKGLHSHLGGVRRWFRTLPVRTQRQKRVLLQGPSFAANERELLRQVETRISAGDGMYTGDEPFRRGEVIELTHLGDTALATIRWDDGEIGKMATGNLSRITEKGIMDFD